MTVEQKTQQDLYTQNMLFEVHMLLLKWGIERLAQEKATAEGGNGLVALTPSTESAPTEKVGTPSLSPEMVE